MRIMKNKILGVTILEILLVLVIGAVILTLATQQYLSYKRDADIAMVKNNKDILFLAMYRYFMANCAKEGGAFNPKNNTISNTVVVPVSTLKSEGYLQSPLTYSPLVDYETTESSDPSDAYIVQFNLIYPYPERIYKTIGQDGLVVDAPIGNIVLWKAQVAVPLLNVDDADVMQQLLGSTCLSTATSQGVLPCSDETTTSGNYAVWDQLPSTGAHSILSSTIAGVRQFKLMYTTHPELVLVESPDLRREQFFICNG